MCFQPRKVNKKGQQLITSCTALFVGFGIYIYGHLKCIKWTFPKHFAIHEDTILMTHIHLRKH